MKTAEGQAGSTPLIALSDRRPGGRVERGHQKKEVGMLEAILIVLVILWALGFFAFHAGGLIHVLIVIALIVLIIRLLQGRKIL